MPNLNRHTAALMENITMLNVKLVKFIALQRKVRDALSKTKRLLNASKRLADRVSELYKKIMTLDMVLKSLSNIPIVGPVMRVLRRGLQPIKEYVRKAKQRVDDLDAKVSRHKTKISNYISFTDSAMWTEKYMQRFLKKEQEQLTSAHDTTNTVEDGRYKNLAQERVNNTAKKLHEILRPPNDIIDATPRPLNDMKLLSEQINRLCKLVEQVLPAIDKMEMEIDRLGPLTQIVAMALETRIGPFSVKKILTALNIPGLGALMDKAADLLEPLLKPLVLKVKSIPGLDDAVDTLEQVSKKLDVMDRLIKKVTNSVTILTGDENPKKTFKRINAGYDFK